MALALEAVLPNVVVVADDDDDGDYTVVGEAETTTTTAIADDAGVGVYDAVVGGAQVAYQPLMRGAEVARMTRR